MGFRGLCGEGLRLEVLCQERRVRCFKRMVRHSGSGVCVFVSRCGLRIEGYSRSGLKGNREALNNDPKNVVTRILKTISRSWVCPHPVIVDIKSLTKGYI